MIPAIVERIGLAGFLAIGIPTMVVVFGFCFFTVVRIAERFHRELSMTETATELTELDTRSTVYRIDSFVGVNPYSVPAHAKSRFSDEHEDVEYSDCYAKVVGQQNYVIVGEVEE